jgi:peroxiredoxin family protein
MATMEGKESITLIVFSGELDKALAAFTLANTAAAMGMDVTMFFTFWGLNAIKREKGKVGEGNAVQAMMNRMNRGGANRLKLSRMNMLGIGTRIMKWLMGKYNMEQIDEMIRTAAGLGVRFVACTTSMAMLGLSEKDFIPEVKEFAGAATYLAAAAEGRVNLFI